MFPEAFHFGFSYIINEDYSLFFINAIFMGLCDEKYQNAVGPIYQCFIQVVCSCFCRQTKVKILSNVWGVPFTLC